MRCFAQRSCRASLAPCTPFFLLLPLLLSLSAVPAFAEDAPRSLEGRLSILWGDPSPQAAEGGAPSPLRAFLAEEGGRRVELEMSDELLAGGVMRWNGRRVRVYPRGLAERRGGAVPVAAIRLEAAARAEAAADVTGSQPWVSLLCKFADIGDEPKDLAYHQGMFDNVPGALDHYWREVSGGAVDIVGSLAIDWVTLPNAQTYYAPTPGSGNEAKLNLVFDDCTAAVDAVVDFSNGGEPFAGINLMLNGVLDCCAWGGGHYAELDGVAKVWRTTWNPPWAGANSAVLAHEMGHGFGLPHANNFDGDSNPYDSPWDVMSSATAYSVADPTYGARGKHVNAYHKDRLGWIPPARRFEAKANTTRTLLLDHTALADAENYQIAVLPIDDTHWYTVEARLRTGEYELSLAGDAVIIHQVDTGRAQPSWAVDADVPPADFSDNPGTMWTVGETFVEPAGLFSVHVEAAAATGFEITLVTGDGGLLFTDDFESGTMSAWDLTSLP